MFTTSRMLSFEAILLIGQQSKGCESVSALTWSYLNMQVVYSFQTFYESSLSFDQMQIRSFVQLPPRVRILSCNRSRTKIVEFFKLWPQMTLRSYRDLQRPMGPAHSYTWSLQMKTFLCLKSYDELQIFQNLLIF